MLILILFILFGSIVAYLAQHNLMRIVLNVGPYVFTDIPLFYVIVGSVLTGLLIGYVIYIIHTTLLNFKLRGKDKRIRESTDEVANLTKRIHQLELENVKLKKISDQEVEDENSL